MLPTSSIVIIALVSIGFIAFLVFCIWTTYKISSTNSSSVQDIELQTMPNDLYSTSSHMGTPIQFARVLAAIQLDSQRRSSADVIQVPPVAFHRAQASGSVRRFEAEVDELLERISVIEKEGGDWN
ncbi:hypothetical protein AcW1_010394 [Taiwanofungus camphoratus]|nr:hypothetical protein AcV5_010548 [Antrodia cinnamomea]KAI0927400.1 hypothetical protein AcV5_010518 [Antrodia cinnamomea]KAI0946869.1 hypothetical protein AcW1_010394 [Antrodia cinnamomea]KAI0956371.1 hypothetical protein AcV7_010413 [Antrodia cinnamomea]